MEFKGIIPAVPTPFGGDDRIDLGILEDILGFLLKAGVHGLFVSGNAGEFYAMTDGEKREVLRASRRKVGDAVPIFFGSGSASTAEACRLTRMAESEGADAISAITPYLVKPSEEELYQYFKAICASTALPVLVYNNPTVTGVAVSPHLMTRLAEIDNLVGVKDSSGDLAITLEYLQIPKKDFIVLAGRDGLILSTLVHGGSGAISSVASACPELAVSIYTAFAEGDLERAKTQQMKFARLRQMFSLGTFPSVVKAALEIRGYPVGAPRAPVAPLAEAKRALLAECIRNVLDS
ncbi:MAG TPA: dihydrodipicolinate synthase family protein [Rectinemataceae bacterium]|nr:dihydrodipicolinate synthase family protein [Rectinemataceae bacterium]